MKSWNGDLSDLNEEEMELFRYAYNRYYELYSYEIFTTKKQINERIKIWKESNWPKKVIDRMKILLYSKLEREKKAQEKWERKQYKRLKRKYAGI